MNKKYNKYYELCNKFDIFIVLCDARDTLLSDYYEAEEIVQDAGNMPTNIIPCIMFSDKTGSIIEITNEGVINNKINIKMMK